ncbi:MAG: LysR family transcriptional regulator [Methanomassiliicoccus sp.]|nr:LysR family transcriptional regulator [Methanomassiliicoccus sp.]
MTAHELKLEPAVTLRVGKATLTTRQLEVLRAVYEEGSQNRAAARLGIAAPVLNRHLAHIEAKAGTALLSASPRGTDLNEEGERIALEYIALSKRVASTGGTVIGGTVITEEMLFAAMTAADPDGECDLIISDDQRNLKDFRAGLMDIIVLDDPMYLFDLESVSWQEVATDRLLHVDRGPRYARCMYGAQRIGFRHLESIGMEYAVVRTFRSAEQMASSGLSYFINESLALRKGLKVRSDTDPSRLVHQINAVYRRETPRVRRLVTALRKVGRRV